MFNKKSTIPPTDIDSIFLDRDKKEVLRTINLQDIPGKQYRIGGKTSYVEWAHVIGIFQTLIYLNLTKKDGNKILDVGCGTGLLAMASQNYVNNDGFYLGLDVVKENIEFCENHYKNPNFNFVHVDVKNAMYSKEQKGKEQHWEVDSDSLDMVTALSVWTHFNEEDAFFYFKEIQRVLKKGGKAIITFFILDDAYYNSLKNRTDENGRFHSTKQSNWIFDKKAYDSENWFYPSHLKIPENAIGITEQGLDNLLKSIDLTLINNYPGNWKEIPGLYFQDVLVFEK